MSSDRHDEYGWQEAQPGCSVPYTVPVLVPLLRGHGVQSVLDLGCGNGGLTTELARAGFEVVGCDRDQRGIEIATASHPDLEFHQLAFEDVPDQLSRRFDAVVSTEVIEHLYDPASLLRCARRMLRPGGVLVLTTPHYGYFKQLSVVLGGLWEEHHQTSRVGGHIKLFSPKAMRQILNEQGFAIRHLTGAGRFWPLWKTTVAAASVAPLEGNGKRLD